MSWSTGLSLRSVMIVGRSCVRAITCRDQLESLSEEIINVSDYEQAFTASRGKPELILVGEEVSSSEMCVFLARLCGKYPDAQVVIVSENPRLDQVVRLMRAGATDYLPAPLDENALKKLVEGLRMEENAKGDAYRYFFCEHRPLGVEIVGKSPALVKFLETVRLVAESRCNPILILGETGTGKELSARAVHWWRYGDFEHFVAVNCATLNANLLESELFGHVKGAFTGADRDKRGLFERAGEGSIFLDEISELPLELQAKLLRVLQERTFRKVGGTEDISCQATVIASSNKNLLEEAEQGRFRKDLYYRLAVFPISIAPLSHPQRKEDIPRLAEYFLGGMGREGTLKLTDSVVGRLTEYYWPGNVRELRNVMHRASILAGNGPVKEEHLIFDHQLNLLNDPIESPSGGKREDFSLEAAEKEFILRALEETNWQRTRAATLLGITRATLHSKLNRYGITAPDPQSQKAGKEDCSMA